MNGRARDRRATLRDAFAAEVPALQLIACVAGAYALFRLLIVAGLPQDPKTLLTLARAPQVLARDFVHFFAVGLVMLAVVEPVRRLGPAAGLRRAVALAVALACGVALATAGRIAYFVFVEQQPPSWVNGYINFVRFGLLASLLLIVGEFHRREVLSLEAMRAAEADRATLEQQTLRARLRTLEAQIEPHFLFNTLANVRRLYDTDGAAGEAMLQRLMRYLEVALPSMRGERSTLAREAELVAAYLDLQRVRMGRRLAYGLDIAPALGPIEVPPMMLLTLVENAIQHGLAPLREGGRVDVEARIDGDELCLAVRDTGRGFGEGTSGGGTGLANIRARLQAMFGPAGELALSPRLPQGIEAAIRMPLSRAAA